MDIKLLDVLCNETNWSLIINGVASDFDVIRDWERTGYYLYDFANNLRSQSFESKLQAIRAYRNGKVEWKED